MNLGAPTTKAILSVSLVDVNAMLAGIKKLDPSFTVTSRTRPLSVSVKIVLPYIISISIIYTQEYFYISNY